MTRLGPIVKLIAVAALLLCVWTIPGHAQFMKREITVSACGGFQYLTGDFGDLVESGSGFQAEVGYFASPSWQLSLAGAYHRYDSEPAARATSGLTGVRYISTAAAASLYLYPESWFTPYATGGAGLYGGRQWYSTGNAERIEDQTRLGLIGGFGLSAHKEGSRLSAFSQLIYHHIITDNGASDQAVVWTTGLRISFGGRPF